MSERIFNGPLKLLGSGTALPGPPITTEELLKLIGEQLNIKFPRAVKRMANHMGIQTRHICRNFLNHLETPRQGDTNPEMSARALREALSDAKVDLSQLGYLFAHTTTPHTLLPPNVSWVADKVGFEGPYMELRQACTGFANCLQLCSGFIGEIGNSPIAIIGSETGSVFFDPREAEKNPEQIINMIQMGDGAGCAVLGPDDGLSGHHIKAMFYGALGIEWKPGLWLDRGGSKMPYGDSGASNFRHDFASIKKNGILLFEAGVKAARKAGVVLEEVSYIITHQVNGRLQELVGPHIGVSPEKFFVNGDRVGNLGSASIWVALDQLRKSGKLNAGDSVLILGAEATKYLYGGFLYVHGNSTNVPPRI